MKQQIDSMKHSRARYIAYWIATGLVTAELTLGGVLDILKLPIVTRLTTHLGYPPYFLILLGFWKLMAAVALLAPRFPRLKEWAYAGVMFNYTGAIASLLIMGDGFTAIVYPILQMGLVIASWTLRPPSQSVVG